MVPLFCHWGVGPVFLLWGEVIMSNIYREPTEAETEAYQKALGEALLRVHPRDSMVTAKATIESIFGPCVYETIDRGKCQVTQCTPGKDGAQLQFILNAAPKP